MRRSFVLDFALVCLLAAGALPACGEDSLKAFRDSLKGQHLVLRNFSADTIVRYVVEGDHLRFQTPELHGFLLFFADGAKLHGNTLTINGHSLVAKLNVKAHRLDVAEKQQATALVIDIGQTGLDVLLPKLRDLLFFADEAAAAARVPLELREVVPAREQSEDMPRCSSCLFIRQDAVWHAIGPKDGKGFQHATLVRAANPEYTEEARQEKINGSCEFVILIDERGRVEEVWLTSPLGYGLDQAGARAAAAYVFKPATYDAAPVASVLTVGVSFQIF